jgi:hypothetical protein
MRNFFIRSDEDLEILAIMTDPNFSMTEFYLKHGREKTVKAMELQIEKDKLEILRRQNERN